MTEMEKPLIEDLKPRLDNWRRVYRDREVKNISITYSVQKALALIKDKTDFSMDYRGKEESSSSYGLETDQRDADFLNFVWTNFSVPEAETLTIGSNDLNVRTAKMIVLIYTFSSTSVLNKIGRKIWRIRDSKTDKWIQDSLLFFALRIRYFEKLKC